MNRGRSALRHGNRDIRIEIGAVEHPRSRQQTGQHHERFPRAAGDIDFAGAQQCESFVGGFDEADRHVFQKALRGTR